MHVIIGIYDLLETYSGLGLGTPKSIPKGAIFPFT